MKILMLGWELPPHNSGGLGVACLYLSKALAGLGHKIDFVVPYSALHRDTDHMRVLAATTVAPFQSLGAYEHFFSDETNTDIRSLQRRYCEFIADYLVSHHYDIVHAHDWLTFEAGMIARQRFGIPLIAHIHATEYDRSGMHTGNQLIHGVESAGLNTADHILAVSESTKQIIHHKYQIPLDRISVVYNSLGDNFFSNSYQYDDSYYQYLEGLKNSGYTIVSTVGRFTLQKGLFNLMRAAARAIKQHPKLIFVFAGDGEQKSELIELAASLGIAKNVLFTGFVRGRRLRDIYSLTDVFVMSSVSEPFGLTALEAAHHGNALIITKQSGVAEILYSILSYDFWDEHKLAAEIVAIASNDELRQSLRQNIKKEYQRISWEDIAKDCDKIYANTLSKKGK